MTPQQHPPQFLQLIAKRLKAKVATRITQFVRCLYPRGHREGDHWRIGDADGTPGQSLAIKLTGKFAGSGYDYATEEQFDAIDLWKRARKVSFHVALREIAQWLQGEKIVPPEPKPATDKRRGTTLIPGEIWANFCEGVLWLHNTSGSIGKLAALRGWPEDFARVLVASCLLSAPKCNWGKRGYATPVHEPFVESEKTTLRLIGIHQRIEPGCPGDHLKWIYLPNSGSPSIPALPLVVGDFFRARKLVITEGQWDAFSLILARGWFSAGRLEIPDGVAIIGLRGASTTQQFLKYYGPYWPARVNALILAQNDPPGLKWLTAGSGTCFAQQLKALSQTVEGLVPRHVKDWNDAYRTSPVDIEAARKKISEFLL